MIPSLRLFTGLAAIIAIAATAWADLPRPTDLPPRYQFQTGQELTYRASSSFKYGEGDNAGALDDRTDSTVWVVRGNADGSFRLVLRQRNTFAQTTRGTKNEQPSQTQFAYADVFPDGRVRPNKTIQFRGDPGSLFPPLPKTGDEAKSGWESARPDSRIVCKPLPAAEGIVFDAVTEAPENKIYLSSSSAKYTFDPKRGLIAKAETASKQGYGFNGSGTGTIELLGVKVMDPVSQRSFTSEADQYFDIVKAYDEQAEAAGKAAPAEAKGMLVRAAEKLKADAAGLRQPDLKAALEDRIKQQEQSAKYVLEEAERRAKVLGQPAAEFETTDLDGKKIRLADLRGQVVVLDFWYRGCGWCVKAMPQMNQLAADFAGQPVAIFGMNTDKTEADARFVVDKMELKYPSLKAEGLPQKFGVQGFPTLIVVDKQGIVRDVHVGYSPTLRDEVGKIVRELLAAR